MIDIDTDSDDDSGWLLVVADGSSTRTKDQAVPAVDHPYAAIPWEREDGKEEESVSEDSNHCGC